MSYSIIAFCSQHNAEITQKATSKKQAMAHHDTMAKTVLRDLGIPRNSKASIYVLHKKQVIVKSNISYGANGTPVIDTLIDPLNLKKGKGSKTA